MAKVDLGLLVTLVNNASSGLKSLAGDVEKVGTNAQATANRLKAIQVVIGGILLEKGLEFGKKFLEAASAVQNLEARMTSWTGSVKASDEILQKFRDTLGGTGVATEDFGNAFIKLKAAGLSDDKAFQTVSNLIQGIAAVGGGDLAGKLESATTAFQLFVSRGVAGQREFRAILTQTGLTMEDLAKAGGMSITEFNEKLKDKLLSSKELLEDFNKAAEQKFKGFAEALSNGTISGAISKFKTDLEGAFAGLGAGTGLNEHIIAIIQNLSKAVDGFIRSIKKEDIDHFFEVIADLEPIGTAVASVIFQVAKGVIAIVDISAKLLNLLPGGGGGAVTQYGIIGFALLGPEGALIGGLIGVIDNSIRDLGKTVDDFMIRNGIFADFFKADRAKLDQTTLEALVNTLNGVDKALPGNKKGITVMTDEQLKLIKDAEAALHNIKLGGPASLTPLPDNVELENTIKKLRQQVDNVISKTTGQVALQEFQTAGDEIDAKIQQITDKTQQWSDALKTAKTDIDTSKMSHAEIVKYDQAIASLQDRITAATAAEVALARDLYAFKQKEFGLEQDLLRMRLQETERQLRLAAAQAQSPTLAALSATPGGQLAEQIAQQTASLQQTITQYTDDLVKVQEQIRSNAGNPEKVAELNQTAAEYQRIIELSQSAMAHLSAEASLETKFWGELGNTISNDVGDAINGLIQGTETWADAGRKLFGDLIQMAIKYIEQLIEIQLFQSALGGGGLFGGGGGFLGILGGLFADGGVFPGGVKLGNQITPFADGGLTQGPTLFGLAGEAGTEAIMPLTRVGGKLGVHSTGGGANHYHITVQAIDTVSGLQFIGQHIHSIDAGLHQARQLNTRAGKY